MSFGLRERLALLSDDGASFAELVNELDIYKDTMPQRQYDELWLFCWTLAKRQIAHSLSGRNGDPWSHLS